jgi:hypothetical protein
MDDRIQKLVLLITSPVTFLQKDFDGPYLFISHAYGHAKKGMGREAFTAVFAAICHMIRKKQVPYRCFLLHTKAAIQGNSAAFFLKFCG